MAKKKKKAAKAAKKSTAKTGSTFKEVFAKAVATSTPKEAALEKLVEKSPFQPHADSPVLEESKLPDVIILPPPDAPAATIEETPTGSVLKIDPEKSAAEVLTPAQMDELAGYPLDHGLMAKVRAGGVAAFAPPPQVDPAVDLQRETHERIMANKDGGPARRPVCCRICGGEMKSNVCATDGYQLVDCP